VSLRRFNFLIAVLLRLPRCGRDERGRENRIGFGACAPYHRFGLGTLAALKASVIERPLYERARFRYRYNPNFKPHWKLDGTLALAFVRATAPLRPREHHARNPNFGRGHRAGDCCSSMVDFSLKSCGQRGEAAGAIACQSLSHVKSPVPKKEGFVLPFRCSFKEDTGKKEGSSWREPLRN
jgi:hypothetical protein